MWDPVATALGSVTSRPTLASDISLGLKLTHYLESTTNISEQQA